MDDGQWERRFSPVRFRILVSVLGLIVFLSLLIEVLIDKYSPGWFTFSRDVLWFPLLTSYLLTCIPLVVHLHDSLNPERVSDRTEILFLVLLLFGFTLSNQAYVAIAGVEYGVFQGMLNDALYTSTLWSFMSLVVPIRVFVKNIRRFGVITVALGVVSTIAEFFFIDLLIGSTNLHWVIPFSLPMYTLSIVALGVVLLLDSSAITIANKIS